MMKKRGSLFGPRFTKNAFCKLAEGIFAERTRFELVVQNNPYGSLANCWFQPLTHLSGSVVQNGRPKGRDCKDTIFLSIRKRLRQKSYW